MLHAMLANKAFAFLFEVALRGLVLLILAGLVSYLLRQAAAAARHSAWLLTLAALLCLPVLCLLMPPLAAPNLPALFLSGPLPAVSETAPPSVPAAHPAAVTSPTVSAPRTMGSPQKAPANVPSVRHPVRPVPQGSHEILTTPPAKHILQRVPAPSPSRIATSIILFAWAAGVLAILLRISLGLASAARVVRRCHLVTSGPLWEAAQDARAAFAMPRPLSVRVGDVAVPMTTGLRRPVLLLPDGAADWPAERLRAALLHETAHIQRHDWATRLLAQCVCALYWFQPLVWLAAARLRAEAEGACDDLVLSSGVPAPDYAAHLLEIVRALASRRAITPGTVAIAHRADVSKRITAILTPGQNRRVWTKRTRISACLAAVAIVVPLAALRPGSAATAAFDAAQSNAAKTAPSLPPATLASGARTQGAFTLLAVTRNANNGVVTLPAGIAQPPSSVTVPITASEMGTGIWIKVQGGIGYHVLTVPLDGQQHTYAFGPLFFTVHGRPPRYTMGWSGPDGSALAANTQVPYQDWTSSTGSHPNQAVITLVPLQLTKHFFLTAQPLSATGVPLGRPIQLMCQPVTSTVLFAEIPTGYSAATRQMQVTAARTELAGQTASWRLTHLPASVPGSKHGLSLNATASYGPIAIRAAAAESEDLSGNPGFLMNHPDRPAGGGWFLEPPSNADGHGWTGVPTIRFMIKAHNALPYSRQQSWMIRLNRVTPEWETSAVTPNPSPNTSLAVFSVDNFRSLPLANQGWIMNDWQAGVDYSGEQHWIRIDGEVLQFVYKTETVTFHHAAVVQDAPFGVNRVVWAAPESQTTPSGITITVLNGKAGTINQYGTTPGSENWRFEGGNSQLLVAWHLPPKFVTMDHAAQDAADEVWPPTVTGQTESGNTIPLPPLNWPQVTVPGQADAQALNRAGFTPLCLVEPPPAPHQPPAPPVQPDNVTPVVAPALPPHHLQTITLSITVREQQESHPFHLLVPVGSSFPPGWNPDAADGRWTR